jgi:hypothetical protein
LFPAKPEKLSFSLEEVVPIPQTTIAATFIGEGYLMAGPWGSVLFGCALGALCSLWNRIPVGLGTPGPVILYASGFHWALLASRSPMWLSIGMLPGLAFVFAWTIAFPVARRLLPAQGERIHGSARL